MVYLTNVIYVITKEIIWKDTKSRFTKIRKTGFAKRADIQHVWKRTFLYICEFTLPKNRTNVRYVESAFQTHIEQINTVKSNIVKTLHCKLLNKLNIQCVKINFYATYNYLKDAYPLWGIFYYFFKILRDTQFLNLWSATTIAFVNF